jgi:transcriptional repressor NrdR
VRCPKCKFDDTKVLESRVAIDGQSIRRRRECRECEYRFTTYENLEEFVLQVRKRLGHIEPYSREKAIRSIQIACQKRPIPVDKLESMLTTIERTLEEKGIKIVESKTLGHMILESLGKLDQVAYVRFASVYKDFSDPNEFLEVLTSIIQKNEDLKLPSAKNPGVALKKPEPLA